MDVVVVGKRGEEVYEGEAREGEREGSRHGGGENRGAEGPRADERGVRREGTVRGGRRVSGGGGLTTCGVKGMLGGEGPPEVGRGCQEEREYLRWEGVVSPKGTT